MHPGDVSHNLCPLLLAALFVLSTLRLPPLLQRWKFFCATGVDGEINTFLHLTLSSFCLVNHFHSCRTPAYETEAGRRLKIPSILLRSAGMCSCGGRVSSPTWSEEGWVTTGVWNDPQDLNQPGPPLLVPLSDECPPATQSSGFQDPCSVVIPRVCPRGMCFRRVSTPLRPGRKEEALWILASARPKLHKQRLFCLPGRRRRNSAVSLRSDHMTPLILPHIYISELTGTDGRSKCSLGCGSNSELRSVTADLCRGGGCTAPLPVLALPLEGHNRVAEWKH